MVIKMTLIFCLVLVSTAAQSAWMARCQNDGICEAYVCVANPTSASEACQRKCGFNAVVTNLSTSGCTPSNASVFEWKASDYEAVNKKQEADKAPFRQLGNEK